MAISFNFDGVAQAIQLALGPVFLLTGIAGLLNVMTGRLSRIIDRGRFLTESEAAQRLDPDDVRREIRELDQRRQLASRSIFATVLAALSICVSIVTLFLDALARLPMESVVGVFFTIGTLALVVGLAAFLREVHLATKTVRF